MKSTSTLKVFIIVGCLGAIVRGGPYNEPGVNGYIGPDWQHASPGEPNAMLNPIFRGWATEVASYAPAPDVGSSWVDPLKALGPAAGDQTDIVSLGDLDASQIAQGTPPGRITIVFGDPCNPDDPAHIRDVNGYDFVVFENSFISIFTNPIYGFVEGQVFGELGYVEVSTDGVNFVRFPSVSLTDGPVGPFGTIDINNVYNLAGKHPNGYGVCTGTPFDLRELANEPAVRDGTVDINNIVFVRIVDIPGTGDFNDLAVRYIDPNSFPAWQCYDANHRIYDPWLTMDSSGVDLEAIGVLKPQNYSADINLDGIVDCYDLTAFMMAWISSFGDEGWIARCDLATPKNLIIDLSDFAILASQWRKVEQWRSN